MLEHFECGSAVPLMEAARSTHGFEVAQALTVVVASTGEEQPEGRTRHRRMCSGTQSNREDRCESDGKGKSSQGLGLDAHRRGSGLGRMRRGRMPGGDGTSLERHTDTLPATRRE